MYQPPERGQQEAQYPPCPPGCLVQPPAGPGAHQGEVGCRSQRQTPGHVQPHPSGSQQDAAGKEDGAGPQPEQQVQGPLEGPPGGGQAQGAEQVIEQPHHDACGQAQGQGADLIGKGEARHRKSRPSRPRRGGSSSS